QHGVLGATGVAEQGRALINATGLGELHVRAHRCGRTGDGRPSRPARGASPGRPTETVVAFADNDARAVDLVEHERAAASKWCGLQGRLAGSPVVVGIAKIPGAVRHAGGHARRQVGAVVDDDLSGAVAVVERDVYGFDIRGQVRG